MYESYNLYQCSLVLFNSHKTRSKLQLQTSLGQLRRAWEQTAPSQSTSSQQNTTPTLIPTQRSVCRQIIKEWGPYAEVRDKFNSARHKEQLSLHCPQKIAATDDNSALREEMRALEPEEENAQPRTLRWVPLGFLGKIGPRHHADKLAPFPLADLLLLHDW